MFLSRGSFTRSLVLLSIVLSLVFTVPAPGVRAASFIRVTPTGITTWPCGDTWATACELQTALANATSGDEIWVAAGTYKPTTSTDRFATFHLKNGVALYGGFAGTETARDQRDWTLNITTLSGDIGAPLANHDNSYHVVVGATGATLDGFTVTGGNASDPYTPLTPTKGGGLYNFNSNPTVTHVIFQDNTAVEMGGGMYNENSSPIVTYVTFSQNIAVGAPSMTNNYGGGMANINSNPTLTDVTFVRNSGKAGGLYNDNSSPTLTDVTFIDNPDYALLDKSGSNPQLTNVTFSYNQEYPVGITLALWGTGVVTLTNVTIYGGNNSTSISGPYGTVILRNTLILGICSVGSTYVDGGGNVAALGCGTIPVSSAAAIKLKPLADNGGATATHALSAGSAAIGAGVAANCPPTDQRGQPRYGTCDSGAYEYNPLPFVTASSASAVNATGATLHAFVNANAFTTTATFEYGLTTSYGLTITASPGPFSSTIDMPVAAVVSALTPDTVYHFRAMGVNINGTGLGDDQVFTTTASTITYADPLGVCGGHAPCYTGPQAAINAAPSSGQVTVYGGTYPEQVTLSQPITITCTDDVTLNGLSQTGGTLTAPIGTLTLNGDFAHTGGTFNANGGTVAFIGSNVTRTLTATVPTQFYNLTVGSGITLTHSTNNDNTGVNGTLINNGAIYKSFSLTGVSLLVKVLGGLKALAVLRYDQSHPQATTGIQTGQYWHIEAITTTSAAFNLGLTLPHNNLPDPKVCKHPGNLGGAGWDCARDDFNSTSVWRSGINALSDWAVGNAAGPTAVKVERVAVSTNSIGQEGLIGVAGVLVAALLVGGRLWRRRRKPAL